MPVDTVYVMHFVGIPVDTRRLVLGIIHVDITVQKMFQPGRIGPGLRLKYCPMTYFPDPLFSHKSTRQQRNHMTNTMACVGAVDWLPRTVGEGAEL